MEKPRPRSTGLLRFQGGTSDGRETVTIKLNASEFGCVPGGVGFGRRPFPFVTLASLSNSRRNPASAVDAQPGFPQPDQVLIPGGEHRFNPRYGRVFLEPKLRKGVLTTGL